MVSKVGYRTIARNGSRECLGCLQGSHQKKKIQISKFRERLAEQLLNLGGVVHVTPAGSSSTHHLVERTGSHEKRIRRTCSSCYAKMKKQEGRDNARKMTQKSYTYCDLCPGQPQMCLKCFNEVHQ